MTSSKNGKSNGCKQENATTEKRGFLLWFVVALIMVGVLGLVVGWAAAAAATSPEVMTAVIVGLLSIGGGKMIFDRTGRTLFYSLARPALVTLFAAEVWFFTTYFGVENRAAREVARVQYFVECTEVNNERAKQGRRPLPPELLCDDWEY